MHIKLGLLNGQTAAQVFPRISSATDLKEALKGAVHAQVIHYTISFTYCVNIEVFCE